MTTTQQPVLDAMVAHHRSLEREVTERAGAIVSAAHDGLPTSGALTALLAYLGAEVLPHTLAEEETVYVAAAASSQLAALVAEMTGEHQALIAAIEQLAGTDDDLERARLAEEIARAFRAHVEKENEMLLPRLFASEGVDPEGLLAAMQARFAVAKEGTAAGTTGAEAASALVTLLLKAADELCDAGRSEQACRLAASAWVALRQDRPDLAVRITAALHRLARLVNSTEATIDLAASKSGATTGSELDVRSLAPAERHELIFATYGRLRPGEGFVLVNDHDPKPLRYQFEAEHAGAFTWDDLESGPQVWRVRIARPRAEDSPARDDDAPELDVRTLPHARRHEIIFATFNALAPGRAFTLVNDHDPLPLRYQLEAGHPGRYSWEYAQSGPQLWRIRIGKPA